MHSKHGDMLAQLPLVIGHRGSPGIAQENSMEGFTLALANGADGVELDVVSLADGSIVVLHPASLRSPLTPSTTRFELSCQLGRNPEDLCLVLGQLPQHATVFIEFKRCGFSHELGCERELAEAIRATGRVKSAWVHSSDPWFLACLQKECPDLMTALILSPLNCHDAAVTALRLSDRFTGFSVSGSLFSLHLREVVAKMNRAMIVWTVDELDELLTHMDAATPVDMIITNVPDRAVSIRTAAMERARAQIVGRVS